MQELYGSPEGERKRIGAYGALEYMLLILSKEDPYHMLEGKVKLAPVLQTNFNDCNEGALG